MLQSYQMFPSYLLSTKHLKQKAPAVKYDHTASSGGLWPLPGQRKHQQDADKEMQNSIKFQTLTPLI